MDIAASPWPSPATLDSCDEGPAGGSLQTWVSFQRAPLIGWLSDLGQDTSFRGLQPPYLEAGDLIHS